MQIGFAGEGLPLPAFLSSQVEEPLFCVCSTKLPAVQTGKRSHWKKTWFSCDLDRWSFIPINFMIWWIKFHFQKWASATRDVRLKSQRRVHHWKSQSRVYSEKIRLFWFLIICSKVFIGCSSAPVRDKTFHANTGEGDVAKKFSWC